MKEEDDFPVVWAMHQTSKSPITPAMKSTNWCTVLFLQNIRPQKCSMWQNGSMATYAGSKQTDGRQVKSEADWQLPKTDDRLLWKMIAAPKRDGFPTSHRYPDWAGRMWDMWMECNVHDDNVDSYPTSSDEWRCQKVQRIMDPHSEHPEVEPDPVPNGIQKKSLNYTKHTINTL